MITPIAEYFNVSFEGYAEATRPKLIDLIVLSSMKMFQFDERDYWLNQADRTKHSDLLFLCVLSAPIPFAPLVCKTHLPTTSIQSEKLFSFFAFLGLALFLVDWVLRNFPNNPSVDWSRCSSSPICLANILAVLAFMHATGTSVSLSFVLFVSLCAVAAAVSVICVCWGCDAYYNVDSRSKSVGVLGNLGFRGFVIGLFYGLHYVYKHRWVLRFPIIQRPPFFSFKMGLPLSIHRALKFSAMGFALSGVLALFLPNDYKSQGSVGKFIVEQIIFYIGSFAVILCWELIHHLHQLLHTKRFLFAPSKGSAAAETNPSEPLLATLEESTPKSLLQYLAYLDLCMVCENNVDTWRRAAFFEETGETYRRVIAACLRPLEQFTENLTEALQSSSAEKPLQLSDQLSSPTERIAVFKLHETFFDSQLCAWSARIVASLTARSHKEDKFGVAQLSGSNAAVISTLLSSLLAVETLMGKKTHIQSAHLMGPAGIKWATVNTGRRESTAGAMGKIRGSPLYGKAYSLADVLKTSTYCIVSTFHNEMMNSGKAGLLEKDWIISGSDLLPLKRECLVDKLGKFLQVLC
ncbi:hypothetical protein DH2020_019127 [Rehmannia glutinosa]|uniref:Uncharacterized protein n=1 Tax=Rehmannia glutinosa TaxID=99300 RepID=A0ABR0WQ83_REHGL